jgi:hypothetical protein
MKITKATLKSFVKNNITRLYIARLREFDGMVDGVVSVEDRGFALVRLQAPYQENTLGIHGVWLVGNSRDYFTEYDDGRFKGIEVSNCCGSFILGVKNV